MLNKFWKEEGREGGNISQAPPRMLDLKSLLVPSGGKRTPGGGEMLNKDTEGGSVDTYKDLHTMQCVTAEPWTQNAETPRSSPHSVLD